MEKEAVTFAICVRTIWYEEKVSNFEIAVAKLKKTLRNVKFATHCRSVAVPTVRILAVHLTHEDM